MVAEVIYEAQLVVYGAEIVGLRCLEGVVELGRAVYEAHSAHKHRRAEHEADYTDKRFTFFRRIFGLFERQKHTEHYKGRRERQQTARLEPGQRHIVAARGVRRLLDERDVPRHEGLAADGELNAVYEGHYPHYRAHGRGAPENVPKREGEGRDEQRDRQPVEHKDQGLMQHLSKHGKHGHRVRPERKQRHHDAARKAEQYRRQETDGSGVSFQILSCFLSAYCAGIRVR